MLFRSLCTKMPKYYDWRGYIFENVCYKHVAQIRKKLNIQCMSFAAPWHSVATKECNGAEIDMLLDRDDDAINLFEIKCTDNPYVADKVFAQSAENKIKVFLQKTSTKKQLFFCLITMSGVKINYYADQVIDDSIVLQDLFLQ